MVPGQTSQLFGHISLTISYFSNPSIKKTCVLHISNNAAQAPTRPIRLVNNNASSSLSAQTNEKTKNYESNNVDPPVICCLKTFLKKKEDTIFCG